MNKIRKFLMSFLLIVVAFAGFVFSACGQDDDNMTITLSSTSVDIVLGENDNKATVTALVENAKNLEVRVDHDSQDISITYSYKGNGLTEINIEAFRQCSNVDVRVQGTKKTAYFKVNAITPVNMIASKSESYFISYDSNLDETFGGKYILSNDLLNLYPEGTNQTEIRYELTNDINGVSIENNILYIDKNLDIVPSEINVEAISVFNDSVKTTLHFEVVSVVDVSKVNIYNEAGLLLDDGTKLENFHLKLARNKNTQSALVLMMQIPFTVSTNKLTVNPVFNGDAGIVLNKLIVNKTEYAFEYVFEFSFETNKDKSGRLLTNLWFEIYDENYPSVKATTLTKHDSKNNNIGIFEITTFDEITDVSYIVDGTVTNLNEFSIYTLYDTTSSEIDGLEIKFDAIPTTAVSSNLYFEIDTTNRYFDFLSIKNSSGSEITNSVKKNDGKYRFNSGDTFYFMVLKTGFKFEDDDNPNIVVYIKCEDNESINKSITLNYREGLEEFGFVNEFDELVSSNVYYLENDSESEYFENEITFGVSPFSIMASSFEIIVSSDVFEIENQIVVNDGKSIDGIKCYKFNIHAVPKKTGVGTITIKYESGQKIKCDIVVIEKLSNVNIGVDVATNEIINAIGNATTENGSLSYIAIKNNQAVPLKFTSNSKINLVNYQFYTYQGPITSSEIYTTDSLYNSFNNLDVNEIEFSDSTNIVRADTLRKVRYLSAYNVGKVWVKCEFHGEMLTEGYKYSDCVITKYFLVESYNPVISLSVSEKNIELYPYKEVGENNKSLSQKTLVVELNKGTIAPTYNRILWKDATSAGNVIELGTDNAYRYKPTNSDIEVLNITKVDETKYVISVLTRFIENDIVISNHSMTISVPDINPTLNDWSYQINISLKQAILVDEIVPTNVPSNESGYYINLMAKSISTKFNDNNFKILTNVLPNNALNQGVVYTFIPDIGTNSDIISISSDGIVSVLGEVGGTGIIRILPLDSVLVDEFGNKYYRENAVYKDIRIVVSDGTRKETAINISSMDEFEKFCSEHTGSDISLLHYMFTGTLYELNENLFENFSGGLYGKTDYSNNIAEIKLNNCSLFDNILIGAIVENFIVYGNTMSAGLIANENSGTIKNVVVDTYANNVISTVESDADYVGGLVGINNGIIEGCTFAGTVAGKTYVGGLAGKNTSTIRNSKVLIYKLNSDSMKFASTYVGGLVGEMIGVSKIEKCSLYNFDSNNFMKSSCYGVFACKVDNDAIISECFANLNISLNSDDVKFVYEGNANKVVRNCYVDYIDSADSKEHFKFYMIQINGVVLFGDTNDYMHTYTNVSFGSSTSIIWNAGQSTVLNGGFPYLNNNKPEKYLSAEDIMNLKIQKTDLSCEEVDKENSNVAVMYYYKPNKAILSNREVSAINTINTISFYDLFGALQANGLNIVSNNSNVIKTFSNSLQVKSIGTCKLTINSKYDSSLPAKEIIVCVLYYTSNFQVKYYDIPLGDESSFGAKLNSAQKLVSSIKDSVVLFDERLDLVVNNFDVIFSESDYSWNITQEKSAFIVGDKIGTHILSITFDNELLRLKVKLDLDLSSYPLIDGSDDYKQIVKEIIESNYSKKVTVRKTYGPNNVYTTMSNAEISPNDEISFNATIYTDDINDYKTNAESQEKQYDIFVVLDEDNNVVENVFDITYKWSKEDEKEGYVVYNFVVTLNKDNLNKVAYNSIYTLKLLTKDQNIYATVKIKVISQEVIRIDINNYAENEAVVQIGSEQFDPIGTTYNYYPNNTISPSSSSLLDIMLYPSYSNYTYLTVTSDIVDGEKLSLVSMRKGRSISFKEATNAYYIDFTNNFEFIENGVKIYKNTTSTEIGRYFVKVASTKTVKVESVFNIYVNVYNNDEIVYTQIYPIIIQPQEKPGLYINGQEEAVVLNGSEVTVEIIKDKEQKLDNNYKIDDSTLAYAIFNNDWVNFGTKYEKATFTLYISDKNTGDFYFRVQTSRILNGKEEIVESELHVYVIPFELDFENASIANEEANDVFVGDTNFWHELKFNIPGLYTEAGEKEFNKFTDDGVYSKGGYKVNLNGTKSNPYKENLYYVEDDGSFTKLTKKDGSFVSNNLFDYDFVQNEDGYFEFLIKGKTLGTQKMRLEYLVRYPNGIEASFIYEFTIKIRTALNDDEPKQIYNESQFRQMFANGDVDHYILMNDIYLYDYTPYDDTKMIESLDGNGHQINIMNFNYDKSVATANFALFKSVSENTTLKNLIVNIYNVNEINLDSNFTTEFNFAPIAIDNYGIITNTEVISYRYSNASDIVPNVNGINITANSTKNITAKTSGFVINNHNIITNSRVGGTDFVSYKVNNMGRVSKTPVLLDTFVISSFGDVAGFVHTNSGHIASSYVSSVRIVNNSNVDYTTITSGFVINNSGTISMSYTKGVKNSNNDIHATKFGIETSGVGTGFVYFNEGSISDCYSNIPLTNQLNNPGRSSSGFVYINSTNGEIKTSLSLSRIIGSTSTQMNFAGVSEWGEYQNNGVIENSYYYDQIAVEDETILVEKAYGESAQDVGSVVIEEYFYGFNFTTKNEDADGIWKMTSYGPELVSANSVAVSLRYSNQVDGLDKSKTIYVDDYKYGSKNNPILIKSANEFNEVFTDNKGKVSDEYVDSSTKKIFGNYRLVNNIDLNTNEDGVYKLISSDMELTGEKMKIGDKSSIGKFDGNGFTISNLAISDSNTSGTSENFGMFAKVTNNAIVMNVNIVIGVENESKEIFGIEAKNTQNVGTLCGTLENSKVINVNVISEFKDTNSVTIRGRNIVGGVIGRVIGDSYISNISVKDITVTSVLPPEDYNNNGYYITYNLYSRHNNEFNNDISYAGSIVGLVDTYTEETINIEQFADAVITSNANVIKLTATGAIKVEGGTVGGLIGYSGPLTVVQDCLFEVDKIKDSYSQTKILSYNGFAGGIVGINLGYLRQVRAEHNNTKIIDKESGLTLQDTIERSMPYYYKGNSNELEFGSQEIFAKENYYPIAIGGLVGLQCSGKIEKSYSKINVIASINKNDSKYNTTYAGGAIGIIDTLDANVGVPTFISEVYATGDVKAQVAAGFTGLDANKNVETLTTYEKVNAVNFWTDFRNDSVKPNEIYPFVNFNKINESKYPIVGLYSKCAAVDIKVMYNENVVNALDGNIGSVPLYSGLNISGNANGEMFDVIFVSNDWDPNSWLRDKDEFFPHIIFGYSANVVYIRNQRDLEKLRSTSSEHSGRVTYVLDPEDIVVDGKNQITERNGVKEKYIIVNRNIAPISGFSNVLRGLDDKEIYGIKFVSNQTRPLFDSTLNATLKDFTVVYDGAEMISAKSQISSLVTTANNTEFTNLNFNDIKISYQNSNTNSVAIVCADAKGSTEFSKININNCLISSKQNCDNANIGLLFANSRLSGIKANVSAIKIINSKIVINNKIENTDNDNYSNIGLLAGNVNYISDTEKLKLVVNDSMVDENSNITFGNSVNVSCINIGNLYGQVKNAEIVGSDEHTNVFTNLQLASIASSNIGGIAGVVTDGIINNFDVYSNLRIGSIDNTNTDSSISYVGMVVGDIQNSTATNVIIKNAKSADGQDDLIGLKIDDIICGQDLSKQGENYIGGFAGNSSANLKNVISYADMHLSSNSTYNAGLLVGKLSGDNPQISECGTYGNMIVLQKNNAFGVISGFISNILAGNNSEVYNITKCFYYGNLISAISKDNNELGNIIIGGIIGNISPNSMVNMSECASIGNTYPMAVLDESTNSKLVQKSVSSDKTDTKYKSLTFGGLIGNNSSNKENVELTNNYCINTFFNKLDNQINTQGEYFSKVKALVGSGSIKDCEPDKENYYSHVYTLLTDNNGINSYANELLEQIKNVFVNTEIKIISDEKYLESGKKLNPITQISSEKVYENVYVYLASKNEASKYYQISLKNSVFLSDGAQINLQSDKPAPFVNIDENSSLSGVVILANVMDKIGDSVVGEGENNQIAAGLARNNSGIIYSCNVRGNMDEHGNITGSITSNEKVAGMVGSNSGLIKDCFTALNLVSNYKSNGNAIAGMALSNSGYIISSYTSGSIQNYNPNKVSERYSGRMYLFAPGSCYGCYSISKIVANLLGGNDKTRKYAFDKIDGYCFYDLYACENQLNDESLKKITDAITIKYEDETVSSDVQNLYYGDFTCNKENTFGYGSFTDKAYSTISYMHHNTGNGTCDNPYQIPNIGKLNQIYGNGSTETIYYNLIQDINCKYINKTTAVSVRLLWSSKDLDNIIFDGELNKIAELDTNGGGIFGNVNNSTIQHLVLSNVQPILPEYEEEDVPKDVYFGVLANEIIGNLSKIHDITVNTQTNILTEAMYGSIKVKQINFGFITGKVSGGVVSNCNLQISNDSNNSRDIIVESNHDYVIGGFVGELVGGSVTNLTLNTGNNGSEGAFSVQFSSTNSALDKSYKYIVGGIVGKVTTLKENGTITSYGKVENSKINASVYAFNDGYTINGELELCLGGIVGKVEELDVSSLGGDFSPFVNIKGCFTNPNVKVEGGNIYSFKKCYVGGICGYGGILEDCKNTAGVVSRSRYYYYDETNLDTGSASNNFSTSTYDEDANKHLVYSESLGWIADAYTYEILNKLLYARVRQFAYAAGISNEYQYIRYCMNDNSKSHQDVSGGTDSRILHSHYNLGKWKDITKKIKRYEAWETGSVIVITSGFEIVKKWPGWKGKLVGIIVGGVGIGSLIGFTIAAKNLKCNINQYYMPNFGYSENTHELYSSKDLFIGNTAYYKNSLFKDLNVEDSDEFVSDLWNKITSFESRTSIGLLLTCNFGKVTDKGNLTFEVPYGSPKATNPQLIKKSNLDEFSKSSNYKLIKNSDKDIYYTSGNQIAVYDVYFDSIGISKKGIIAKNAYGTESSYSNTPIYKTESVNIGGVDTTVYGLYDSSIFKGTKANSRLIDEYHIYYKDPEKALEKTTKVISLNNEGLDLGEEWTYENEDWKLSTEINRADINVVLKDLCEIDNDSEKIVFNIKKQTTKDGDIETTYDALSVYNMVSCLIDDLSQMSKDKIVAKYQKPGRIGKFDYCSNDNLDKLKKLCDSVQKSFTFEIHFMEDVKEINTTIIAKGLNATFIGDSKVGGEYVSLSSVTNTQRDYNGLVASANDVKFENLSISYSGNNYLVSDKELTGNEEYSSGALVAKVEPKGKLEVRNVNVSYAYNDYSHDTLDNIISSKSAVNIGAIVGYVDQSNVQLENVNILSTKINSALGYDVEASKNDCAIGGLIGKANSSSLVVLNSRVEDLNITSQSSIQVVGGVVGRMYDTDLTLSDFCVSSDKSSKLKVENKFGTTSIVGGIVGKLEVTGGLKNLNFATVNIEFKSIMAQAGLSGVTTYAGAILGYLDASPENVSLTISDLYLGKENEETQRYEPMYIMSGVGGSSYANIAYADTLIGNRSDCDGPTEETSFIKKLNYFETEEVSQLHKNTKGLSMSTPNYAKEDNSSLSYFANNVVNSEEKIYRKIDEKFDKGKKFPAGFVKIDVFEYNTQIDSNIQNAFVDGKSVSLYNYQKMYLVSVILIESAPLTEEVQDGDQNVNMKDDQVNFYVEIMYKLTIKGQISEDGDSNLQRYSTVDIVSFAEYSSEINPYKEDTYKAFSLSDRQVVDGAFLPKSVGNVEVDKDNMQKYQFNIENIAYIDYLRDADSAELSFEQMKLSEEDNATILTARINHQNEEIIHFNNIYTVTNQDDNSKLSYHNAELDSHTKVEVPVGKETTEAFIQLSEDKTFNIAGPTSVDKPNDSYNVTAYISGIMNIDGDSKNQRVIVILSNKNDELYTDYVYAITTNIKGQVSVYYLGYIEYIINDDIGSVRNDLFFPDVSDGSYAYRYNNLFNLNEIVPIKENIDLNQPVEIGKQYDGSSFGDTMFKLNVTHSYNQYEIATNGNVNKNAYTKEIEYSENFSITIDWSTTNSSIKNVKVNYEFIPDFDVDSLYYADGKINTGNWDKNDSETLKSFKIGSTTYTVYPNYVSSKQYGFSITEKTDGNRDIETKYLFSYNDSEELLEFVVDDTTRYNPDGSLVGYVKVGDTNFYYTYDKSENKTYYRLSSVDITNQNLNKEDNFLCGIYTFKVEDEYIVATLQNYDRESLNKTGLVSFKFGLGDSIDNCIVQSISFNESFKNSGMFVITVDYINDEIKILSHIGNEIYPRTLSPKVYKIEHINVKISDIVNNGEILDVNNNLIYNIKLIYQNDGDCYQFAKYSSDGSLHVISTFNYTLDDAELVYSEDFKAYLYREIQNKDKITLKIVSTDGSIIDLKSMPNSELVNPGFNWTDVSAVTKISIDEQSLSGYTNKVKYVKVDYIHKDNGNQSVMFDITSGKVFMGAAKVGNIKTFKNDGLSITYAEFNYRDKVVFELSSNILGDSISYGIIDIQKNQNEECSIDTIYPYKNDSKSLFEVSVGSNKQYYVLEDNKTYTQVESIGTSKIVEKTSAKYTSFGSIDVSYTTIVINSKYKNTDVKESYLLVTNVTIKSRSGSYTIKYNIDDEEQTISISRTISGDGVNNICVNDVIDGQQSITYRINTFMASETNSSNISCVYVYDTTESTEGAANFAIMTFNGKQIFE